MTAQDIIDYIKSDVIKNIIVDCDAGADGDDQFALAYALTSPDKVKVLFVNSAPYNENTDETVLYGKNECEDVIRAASLDIPVFSGSSDYITRKGKAIESNAAKMIKKTVEDSEGPVFAVITGCSTNVASALSLYPEINEKLIVIWLALDDLKGHQNTGEYNYHNDIEAGRIIFSLAENLVLVCAGKVVAPFAMSKDDVERSFNSGNALSTHLRKRFREIEWAQGLWDLCAESVLIIPEACTFEISKRPDFDDKGEIVSFLENTEMVVVSQNNSEMIISDCKYRINNY